MMYNKIRDHPTVRQVYANRLIDEQIITQAEADQIAEDVSQRARGGNNRRRRSSSSA